MSGQAAAKPVKAAFCAPMRQHRPNGKWHPESYMQRSSPGPKRTQSTGTRGISIALRTLHLASFGILLGGYAFDIESDRLLPALYFTVGSGIELIVIGIYITGPYWLLLGKGMMVLLKLLVLLVVPALWEYRLPLLLARLGRIPHAGPLPPLLLPARPHHRAGQSAPQYSTL